MPEGRAPISSSRIATGDIARHSFAIVRRGYDTDEVRAYLQSLSRSIEALEEREQELRDAAAEAEERAAHPVIDEATLTASLGQHSAQILRHAHEEAARIVAQAQEDAATLLRETQSQVDELQTRTEASSAERVVEVELLVANAEQEARVESERIVGRGHRRRRGGRRPGQGRRADAARTGAGGARRVLADLAARRRTLGIQIEALRAARDEMAASVHGVRDRVDGILAHLDRTDDEARAAAQAVSEQFRLHGGPVGRTTRTTWTAWASAMGEAPPTGPTPAAGPAPDAVDDEEGDGAARRRGRRRSTSCSHASGPGPSRRCRRRCRCRRDVAAERRSAVTVGGRESDGGGGRGRAARPRPAPDEAPPRPTTWSSRGVTSCSPP